MAQALHSHTFRDDRPRQRLKPRDTLVRAAVSELLRQQLRHGELEAVEDVIARRYDGCPATNFYTRAAVSPAVTTTATWAAELVATSVADFMANEMPASAFAQLAAQALTVALEPGTALVKVPSRASPLALQGAWIGEGSAKPVVSTLLSSVTVTPYKLSAISTFSEEMLLSTAIEQLVRSALAHDLTGLLDTALLGSTAASAGVRPAGLFNGVTPITASAATPPTAAMAVDLKALAAAVRSGHPDARVVYIMNPAQALSLQLATLQFGGVIVSGYMAAASVAAVDADALVLLVGQPVFAIGRNIALHMEDTAPLALGTGTQGSGVLAVPLRSSFQEDWVGLRCVLRASWAKLRTGAAAIANSVTW